MTKDIKIGFFDKKTEYDLPVTLVQGDKNAYRLTFDTGRWSDAATVSVHAVRADGKVFYDYTEVSDGAAAYVLKNAMYDCPADYSSILKSATARIMF